MVRNEGLLHGPPVAMFHTYAEPRSVKKAIFHQFSGLPIPAWKGKAVEFRVMMFSDGADGARAEVRLLTPKPVVAEGPLRVGPAKERRGG